MQIFLTGQEYRPSSLTVHRQVHKLLTVHKLSMNRRTNQLYGSLRMSTLQSVDFSAGRARTLNGSGVTVFFAVHRQVHKLSTDGSKNGPQTVHRRVHKLSTFLRGRQWYYRCWCVSNQLIVHSCPLSWIIWAGTESILDSQGCKVSSCGQRKFSIRVAPILKAVLRWVFVDFSWLRVKIIPVWLVRQCILLQSTLFIPTLDTTTKFVIMAIWISENFRSRGES